MGRLGVIVSSYVCETALFGLSQNFLHTKTLNTPMETPKINVSRNVKVVDMVTSVTLLFVNTINKNQM